MERGLGLALINTVFFEIQNLVFWSATPWQDKCLYYCRRTQFGWIKTNTPGLFVGPPSPLIVYLLNVLSPSVQQRLKIIWKQHGINHIIATFESGDIFITACYLWISAAAGIIRRELSTYRVSQKWCPDKEVDLSKNRPLIFEEDRLFLGKTFISVGKI